jgi:hypothetical protein
MDDTPTNDEVTSTPPSAEPPSTNPPSPPPTSESVVMEKRIKGSDGVWLLPTQAEPPPDPFAQLDPVDTGAPPPGDPGASEPSNVNTSQDTGSVDTAE